MEKAFEGPRWPMVKIFHPCESRVEMHQLKGCPRVWLHAQRMALTS